MRIVAGLTLFALVASAAPGKGPASRRGSSEMEAAIRTGTFPKVTSVLIARGGNIVYEKYFDGSDASALRDTRSATKTITSLLVGIAIDQKRIPGVEARILDYLPGRTFQNPDPRKAQITVEDS